MKTVVALLTVLLGVSHAVEIYCDARWERAHCFAALGGTVALQLVDEASEISKYQWMKKASIANESIQIIFSGRNYNLIFNNISNRSVFIPGNGTFKINKLSRSDSGNYTLEIFNSSGKITDTKVLQLTIQAPVSSVRMISGCVPQGMLKASCLSEGGDSPHYTWILNGHTTRYTEILSRNTENNIIILKQNISGNLACSVWNNISNISEERTISACEGEKTPCNIGEDKARCYGALGGNVVIQLMNNTSETPKYQWKHNTSTILRGKRNNYFPNTLTERYLFIPMLGTFSIMNLSRADGGNYTLETFDSNGRKIEKKTLQLIVQAPVSSVQLVTECLPEGQLKVSCLSEGGDSLQYNWTLNEHQLTDSELFSEYNDSDVIVLRQNITGRLVCSVSNRFSSLSDEKTLSTCGFIFINCTSNGTEISGWVFEKDNILCVEPAEVAYGVVGLLTIMGSVLSALLILLAVGTVFICAQREKKTFKVEKDNNEPVYAEVRIVSQQERQTEESMEEEVEDKEETLSELPQQLVSGAENPIYAQVRKVR